MAKPSEWMNDIMAGKVDPTDTPSAIQSWLQFVCYRIAVDMQDLPRALQRERAREYPDAVLEIIRSWYRVAQKARVSGLSHFLIVSAYRHLPTLQFIEPLTIRPQSVRVNCTDSRVTLIWRCGTHG